MKRKLLEILAIVAVGGALTLTSSVTTGCANMSAEQKSALRTTTKNLATVAVEAAATYYGGPAGGQMASAGLSALAQVAQAYVGQSIPPEIVQASPGVSGVGTALVGVISPNHAVSQADVNAIAKAAQIAQTLTPVLVTPKT